ncbi:transcriptional regulator [Pseudoalteromonas sp. NBT06-2]|uniref:helix-turn-helix domain-containing protein n=1 Tax=Pseudoalteromonas sp. NBT06-2 TaxID=2025950 RepID=UPI000BA6C0F0|nr:helix-turn-helix domain-containing protein [Pseudoalteromonas sp. NBT06-2]PAJ72052.1 transcriptional regulator [Pseudoalteromonas sp. NBT06-2]
MNQFAVPNDPALNKRTPKGADILKYARKFRGYTQAESAASYGIEERTLRRWENNEFNPKWNDVIGLIEDVYSLKVIKLIEELSCGTTDNN